MIRFYLGHRQNREQLYSEFVADADKGRPCLLLVPEQFTVHAETRLMQMRPQGFGGDAEVVSFKRLARRVMIACGKSFAAVPDMAVRSVTMMRAFNALRDRLSFYASARLTEGFIAQLCRVDEQMHRSRITPEELETAVARLEGNNDKLSDLSLIIGLYRSMLQERDFAEDEQEQAVNLLQEEDIFADFHIYIDGFYYFSHVELAILERLMPVCDMTFAIEGDEIGEKERETIFIRPRQTCQKLRSLAMAQGVRVQELYIAEKNEDEALAHLRSHLFSDNPLVFEKDTEAVHFHAAADAFDEAEYVASQVAFLRREGYKDGEIAVLCRDENAYKGVLDSVLDMHGISVFADKRTRIQVKPLALLLSTALDIAANDFTTEDVLTHIKTGLTCLNDEDLGRVQRYCTRWEPLPGQWFYDFTDHPDGFTAKVTEKSRQELAKINAHRRTIIEPILAIRSALSKTVGDVCRALYDYMESIGVATRLQEQTLMLDAQGDHARAQECEQTWEVVMKALDALYAAAAQENTDADTFRQLWNCTMSAYDIGRIPTSLDEVLTGRVDHVRTFSRRAVFVIGVNADMFPASVADVDLIHELDRDRLASVGLLWEEGSVSRSREEWLYAYQAFSMPTEKLFITYHLLSDDRQPALPSDFFESAKKLFPNIETTYGKGQPCDRTAAFERLVGGQFADKGLLSYFNAMPEYRRRIIQAQTASEIGKEDIAHSRVLESKLSSGGLSVSPTSLNIMTNCRFQYFCKYVLGLKKIERAEMSSSETGTFVHDILEKILSDYAEHSTTPIWQEEREDVYRKVDERITVYLTDYFAGDVRSARFRYLFGRICETVHELIDRLCDEFAQSAFLARDFELNIKKGGAIEPISIEFEGGSIRMEGIIDRVDMMESDDGGYLRIVDYKTGGKKFDFEEIYNGQSTQMLWYLFSLMKNGGDRYGLALRPAGVLYYPAFTPYHVVSAGDPIPDESEISEMLKKEGAQSGLLLRDMKVLTAMEKDLQGHFINVNLKGEELKGSLVSEKGFTALEEYLEGLIAELGRELLTGDVTPHPLKKGKETKCQYCDYADICGFELAGKPRRAKTYKGSELERKVNE